MLPPALRPRKEINRPRLRLAIARALLMDSRILLLDEATSALDNVTQSRIQEAVGNIRGERTVITIAHRLSTVVHTDRILFIGQGKVLDQGTHRELLERCPAKKAAAGGRPSCSRYPSVPVSVMAGADSFRALQTFSESSGFTRMMGISFSAVS